MDKPGNVIIHLFLIPGILGHPPLPTNKLSLATWESYYEVDHKGPGTYAFGYDIEDPVAGNVQFRQEERHINGTVEGSYGYVDAYGKPVVVTYVADEKGYRVKIEREGSPAEYFPNSHLFTTKLFRIPSLPTNNDVNENDNKHLDYFLSDANIVEFKIYHIVRKLQRGFYEMAVEKRNESGVKSIAAIKKIFFNKTFKSGNGHQWTYATVKINGSFINFRT